MKNLVVRLASGAFRKLAEVPKRKTVNRNALIIGAVAFMIGGMGAAQAWQPQPPVDTTSEVIHASTDGVKPAATVNNDTPAPVEPEVPTASGGSASAPKPPANRNLVISQTSLVVYKNPFGPIQGVKDTAFMGVPLTISTPDGKSVRMPQSTNSSGVIVPAVQDSRPERSSWPMAIYTSYAEVGTKTHTIVATTASGIKYSGSVQITVIAAPIFSIDGDGLAIYTTNASETAELYFDDGRPAYFDFSHMGDFMPKLTVQDYSGNSCTISLTSEELEDCGPLDEDVPPGTYYFIFIFENQFQKVTLPAVLYVDP